METKEKKKKRKRNATSCPMDPKNNEEKEVKKRPFGDRIEAIVPACVKIKSADEKRWERLVHPNLPRIPFTVQIVGPRHRGKSILLRQMISNEKGMYGRFFKKENFVLYSPTLDEDKTLQSLKLKHTFSSDHDIPSIVKEIKKQQRELKKRKNEDHILLIFDDITIVRPAWEQLKDLAFTGRHLNIHTLAVAHKLSSIPRDVRTQMQQWIIFEPHEQSEWEWVLDMFSRKDTRAIWMNALLTRAWAGKYGYLYIDFERKEIDEIYRATFNDPLFTPEENHLMKFGTGVYRNLELDNPRRLSDSETDFVYKRLAQTNSQT